MGVITIREQQQTEQGFDALLVFEHGGEYAIAIQNPYTLQEEQELEWYFEQWIRLPFTDEAIAQRAASSITAYGEQLFKQIFKVDLNAFGEYQALRGDLGQTQWVIEGRWPSAGRRPSPEFQALHWEALKDPDLPRPMAVDAVMTRWMVRSVAVRAQVKPSPVVRVLMVTARPDQESDVAYRTISRPLMEAIQNARLRVEVDLLRPGTFEALSKRLEEKGSGYYHLIHFDVHGGVATYEQLCRAVEGTSFLYRFGQQDLRPYEGSRAFVFMEGEHNGDANPVEASDLVALLTGKGIPVCLLNACQSAKQVNDHGGGETVETSMGSLLMAAGMQMVVAMGYSVTVSAAKLLMAELYRRLFEDSNVAEAIRWGRLELWNRKERRAYFNYEIRLEDWLLPVVYQNQPVDLNLRAFPPQEEEAYFEALGRLGVYQEPTYTFVGRDLEILKIERALLQHNCLLVQGMGGTGKTTLLTYLRDWWQRTQFAREVFYFGYDEKAWTLEQILDGIGQRVYERFDLASFRAMSAGAQVQKLATKLKAEPYGLMLDNVESVTGEPLAIQNTLTEAQRAELKGFLRLLVGGKTKVLFGSRSGEDWLKAETFRENRYVLRGLDPEARTVLAEKILERQVMQPQRIAALREDVAFTQLMKLLAGYPLAMEVVLANLAQQSPAEILAALQAADVDLNVGGDERTNNILKCVDYSHGNLSAAAQQLLLCLAPFSGVIFQPMLGQYVEHLQALKPLHALPWEQLEDAIAEAVNWGLLAPHEMGIEGLLSIQPILPYFLSRRLQAEAPAMREAIYEGFRQHFEGLAKVYQQLMESRNPQEKQMGQLLCRLDYENLSQALEFSLRQHKSVDSFFCLVLFLDLSRDADNGLKLSKYVCDQHMRYPEARRRGQIGWEMIVAIDRYARCCLYLMQYPEARQAYQRCLEIADALTDFDQNFVRQALASTYHNLGRVAQELREWALARQHYNQALEIKIEYGDRYSQASTYHQLGSVAQALREWALAREHYNQALEICIEYGDRYSQASTYHQLGNVAQELREWQLARQHYNQALEIKIEYGDRYSQASTYHQLGIVAQKLREWALARDHYNQALEIFIEYGDRYSQASTYHQLGIVAQELREWALAREHYNQALEIKIEYGDRYSQAPTYDNLGMVAQELRAWALAREHYNQALEIYIEYGDRYSQASTYYQLAMVAEATGDLENAKTDYLKDLEITIEFNDEHGLGISLQNAARFYRDHPDDAFLSEIAKLLGIETAELKHQINHS